MRYLLIFLSLFTVPSLALACSYAGTPSCPSGQRFSDIDCGCQPDIPYKPSPWLEEFHMKGADSCNQRGSLMFKFLAPVSRDFMYRSDCVIASDPCGSPVAINRQHATKFERLSHEAGKRVDCADDPAAINTKPGVECLEDRCILVYPKENNK